MKLVFATNNKNKIKEIKALLPSSLQILSLEDINCKEDIPETADTIAGNALQKAKYIFDNYGYNCFADDTGLKIESLNGEPGIYSARYAGPQRDSNDNMDKVLENLKEQTNRNAHFKTVIALIIDGSVTLIEGIAQGEITKTKSGTEGFGYDPIFKPTDYDITFSEMNLDEKNKISHRGKATQKLISHLAKL
jgi:XTP/dITP diphosphohydrolase